MIREPVVAGRFYDADAKKLRQTVESYLKHVQPHKDKVFGLIVPHAGYVYSGRTAGEGFSHVASLDFEDVVFLGAGHTMHIEGGAVFSKGKFQTPLGDVAVHEDIARALVKKSKIFEDLPAAHEDEHSIEVQIPFLQVLKGNKFKIVPILFNTHDLKILTEAGKIIGETIKDRKVLICVSSDLSHYPPGSIAEKSDRSIMLALKISMRNKDLAYFNLANRIILNKERSDMDTTCCGQAAVIVGAIASIEMGANDFELIKYTHSGHVSGDDSNVVGYATGLFVESPKQPEGRIPLTEDMKKELLHFARKSIECFLKDKSSLKISLSEKPEFNVPGAVFVTLTKNKNLRGCIGTMEPKTTVLDAVVHFAVSSAFEDPRFPAVNSSEISGIKIEISILSPLKRVDSYKDIQEKKHGVYIKKGYLSGTYLPQVWEHFKTKEEFLSSLCHEKAGLSGDAWKDKSTEIYVYTVDAFEED
ncbi:MAG: AmmeMemoRadiSam system protein B [Elusimicrobiota bacterium]